jgi:general secretion pathway protein A
LLLIIDEAQHLSIDVLEEVRLLTNLEGPNCKLIQVILAGQPEFEQTMLLPELRQLRQRIAVAARLRPFSLDEVSKYVHHRLAQSGYRGGALFSRAALRVIWAASEGSPRTINILCDYALVNSFAVGHDRVDEGAAREAVQDVLEVDDAIRLLQKPQTYVVSNPNPGSARAVQREVIPFSRENGG